MKRKLRPGAQGMKYKLESRRMKGITWCGNKIPSRKNPGAKSKINNSFFEGKERIMIQQAIIHLSSCKKKKKCKNKANPPHPSCIDKVWLQLSDRTSLAKEACRVHSPSLRCRAAREINFVAVDGRQEALRLHPKRELDGRQMGFRSSAWLAGSGCPAPLR